MATRKIVLNGDEVLRKVSKKVTNFDDDLGKLLDDLKDTMHKYDGVGIAAVQVGVLRRVIAIEVNGMYLELVNPEIIYTEGKQIGEEGCLSVPKFYDIVERPKKVTCRAQDRFGKHFEITGEDLLARCICHEVDHLDGKLFIDISKNGKKMIK